LHVIEYADVAAALQLLVAQKEPLAILKVSCWPPTVSVIDPH
jgi:hypothetical protein